MVEGIAYITGANYCPDVVVFNYACCQTLVNNRVYSCVTIVSRGSRDRYICNTSKFVHNGVPYTCTVGNISFSSGL